MLRAFGVAEATTSCSTRRAAGSQAHRFSGRDAVFSRPHFCAASRIRIYYQGATAAPAQDKFDLQVGVVLPPRLFHSA